MSARNERRRADSRTRSSMRERARHWSSANSTTDLMWVTKRAGTDKKAPANKAEATTTRAYELRSIDDPRDGRRVDARERNVRKHQRSRISLRNHHHVSCLSFPFTFRKHAKRSRSLPRAYDARQTCLTTSFRSNYRSEVGVARFGCAVDVKPCGEFPMPTPGADVGPAAPLGYGVTNGL